MSQTPLQRPSTLPRTQTTRSRQLSARLQQMALQGGAGAKLPSMPELRRDLGVSMTTLSATVAELESLGVIERRRGVGIFVTENASALVARTLALVVSPSLLGAGHAPFWDVLVRIVEGRARKSEQKIEFHFALAGNSQFHTASNGRDLLHKGLVESIESGAVAGVFLVNTPREVAEWIESQGVPTVTYAGPGDYAVSHDRAEFLRRGIAALLKAGCRRIGVWGASRLWVGKTESVDEFLADEFGAQLPAQTQLLPTQSLPETETLSAREAGWQLAQNVFAAANRAHWPDGVLIDNDILTRGALVALRKAGVSLGDDVTIVSHANRDTDVLADYEDELIRLEYDPTEIVAQMFAIMEKRWQAEPIAAQRVFMVPTLVLPSTANAVNQHSVSK